MPLYLPPISRRTFLRTTTLAATGFMFGCSDSITGSHDGEDDLVDPNYYALLADTHIDHPHIVRHGYNTAENLETIVSRILNNRHRRPAGVIINGDLGDRGGTVAGYGLVRLLLRPLCEAGIPVYITIGNHDLRDPFYEVFEDHISEGIPVANRHLGIIETPNVYMFLLDTSEGMSTPGMFRRGQRHWVDEALQTHDDKPVLLFGHHPAQDLADFQDFFEIVKSHRHAKAYIAGHRHRMELNKEDDIHLLMQPTTGGTGQTTPIGFFHAQIHADRLDFEIDNIERDSGWHGNRHTLVYR